MGLTTVTAARIYKGQKDGKGKNGEREVLSWEKMPFASLAKVFAVDYQVSDSAATATSYLTGIKTNKGVIGVSAKVPREDCVASQVPGVKTRSYLDWAQKFGKATGFVTTTRVTHASPAPLYSNAADRDWEAYADDGCQDIAAQLVRGERGKKLKVILGGGRRSFMPKNSHHNHVKTEDGKRKDGKNLIEEWQEARKDTNSKFITTREELVSLDAKKTGQLLGLFANSHLPYVLDLNKTSDSPSLKEMVKVALDLLTKENPEKGYFLFVEGMCCLLKRN